MGEEFSGGKKGSGTQNINGKEDSFNRGELSGCSFLLGKITSTWEDWRLPVPSDSLTTQVIPSLGVKLYLANLFPISLKIQSVKRKK